MYNRALNPRQQWELQVQNAAKGMGLIPLPPDEVGIDYRDANHWRQWVTEQIRQGKPIQTPSEMKAQFARQHEPYRQRQARWEEVNRVRNSEPAPPPIPEYGQLSQADYTALVNELKLRRGQSHG